MKFIGFVGSSFLVGAAMSTFQWSNSWQPVLSIGAVTAIGAFTVIIFRAWSERQNYAQRG